MNKYTKIQSVFKRSKQTHKFTNEYSLPEFEYLRYNLWEYTEKLDGTNIRIQLCPDHSIIIGGRTDNAQLPTHLFEKLQSIFLNDEMKSKVADKFPYLYEREVELMSNGVCLYGEGFGYKVQKGGKYLGDKCDFALFDVKVADCWLKREDVYNIADTLGIRHVPKLGWGNLDEACNKIKLGLQSTFGEFLAEGMVLRPVAPLHTRNGHRIITKIKHRDFAESPQNWREAVKMQEFLECDIEKEYTIEVGKCK